MTKLVDLSGKKLSAKWMTLLQPLWRGRRLRNYILRGIKKTPDLRGFSFCPNQLVDKPVKVFLWGYLGARIEA